jgi:hypothetical protein
MEVRLESTEGFGGSAEVWVGGTLLCVMDQYSEPHRAATPGLLPDARFLYLSNERVAWEEAAAGNKQRRQGLDPAGSWRYVGYGRIVDVMPVLIDFDVLTMEDPNWSNDNTLIGRYVSVPIDRLTMTKGEALPEAGPL